MEYNYFGNTGMQVSRLCLGAAFRSYLFNPNYDEAHIIRTIHHALDAGINFIDTANFYSYGRSEETVGKALKGRRDDVVLATKVRQRVRDNPKPNDEGLSRYHIMREVERSLSRLQTDHIDIYWLHLFDDNTPIEETLRALDDLVCSGKVRYIGCCNFPAWQLIEGLWQSDKAQLNRFVAIQNQYSLLNRWEIEPDLAPACKKHKLGIVTYSPLMIGLLTGLFRHGQTPPVGTPWADTSPYREKFADFMTPQADQIVQALIEIGQAHGKSPSQVAIRWILAHDNISSVILGPDTPAHVDDALGALGWQLSADERAQLDTLSRYVPPAKIA